MPSTASLLSLIRTFALPSCHPQSYLVEQAAETAFRKADRALEHERRASESAEKAAAAAEKKLEK
jgi:hypothetical protein